MNLYIIRHGKAEISSEMKPDEERELTEEGIPLVNNAAGKWKEFINTFDLVLSSPLKRAIQTAVIIKEVFDIKKDVVEVPSLLNGGTTQDLLNEVSSLRLKDIAMIGHQPDIANHISRLTSHSDINLKIPPAALAKISFKDKLAIGEGILEFLIPPGNKKG